MALPLNSAFFIAATDLQSSFIDKETGGPLAGGKIYFWKNQSRTDPKPVYQLTGGLTMGQYTQLPNFLVLSQAGTLIDTNGNPIQIYYYPRDLSNALELYYIEVFNAYDVLQFTQQYWPQAAINQIAGTIINQQTSSATLAPGFTYICNNSNGLINFTMPLTAAIGDSFKIEGHSEGGWRVQLNPAQHAYFGSITTIFGGQIQYHLPHDSIEITCVNENTTFSVKGQTNIILS